jgi:hypothetical protein
MSVPPRILLNLQPVSSFSSRNSYFESQGRESLRTFFMLLNSALRAVQGDAETSVPDNGVPCMVREDKVLKMWPQGVVVVRGDGSTMRITADNTLIASGALPLNSHLFNA